MTDQHVCIIMGLYNGAPFLREQLDSIVAQTHPSWSLIVSDDGSDDGGLDMVHAFARKYPERSIKVVEGPQQGFAKNFLSALAHVPKDVAYVSFSDQDDVWLPEKLERAILRLSRGHGTRPAMVCGRTWICDAHLNRVGMSPLFTRPPCFQNALVQNIGGGNTMVLNRSAVIFIAQAAQKMERLIAHDWTCYQIITGVGGHVFYEPVPLVLYRQHANNQIGSNNSHWDRLERIRRLFKGDFRNWTDVNYEALKHAQDSFTASSWESFEAFEKGRHGSLLQRIRWIWASKVHRQTRLGTTSLWIAVVSRLI